jgi:hypothetical protein
MSTTIPQAPPVDRVRLVNCPQCWQRPGKPCSITGPAADHLARYVQAEREGLITRAELDEVAEGLEVIAAHVMIWDGAR